MSKKINIGVKNSMSCVCKIVAIFYQGPAGGGVGVSSLSPLFKPITITAMTTKIKSTIGNASVPKNP